WLFAHLTTLPYFSALCGTIFYLNPYVRSGVAYVTTVGTLGGGLLAAVALNGLVESLIEKPNCHCHLK
ncbi:hypothetical protein QUA25_20010, partial [Microcoleus sp. Pol17C6]